MNAFRLTVSSPNGNLFDEEAVFLRLRGVEGELAIMAGHVPFVTVVKPCDCKIELDDGTEMIGHTEGGVLSVASNRVTLLSGSFAWKEKA
ncbi:MAG: F0F1 ATP synthase subunit epsilon [Ruminococcaceae bacterium]|nr:F0F1 ATP synthase subunit epsilon [Oscillospiraceae bacterium]